MASAYCPDCEEKIVINPSPVVGKRLTCPHCGTDVEVVGTDPLKLDWADEESDGDWEDDEDW
jgi:alpha-aminoadipate carrier protein LysW